MEMMTGAIAMGFLIVAIFFFRFWRTTSDRLFLMLGISFVVLAVNRVSLGLSEQPPGERSHHYWIRFAAFALILVAILDKNRSDIRRAR